METTNWLLLTYKVPAEPAKKRVALWRRLKGMGAVYLQNGVCLLPRTDDHARRLKMIENEITEMAGESVLLETVALDQAQENKVIARFKADRDEEYVEFLGKCKDFEAEIAKETEANHFTYAELEENDVDLKKLQSWLEKIRKLDAVAKSRTEQKTTVFQGQQTIRRSEIVDSERNMTGPFSSDRSALTFCEGIKLDFYGANLADEAEQRLKHCEALLDSYAQSVFRAYDENC